MLGFVGWNARLRWRGFGSDGDVVGGVSRCCGGSYEVPEIQGPSCFGYIVSRVVDVVRGAMTPTKFVCGFARACAPRPSYRELVVRVVVLRANRLAEFPWSMPGRHISAQPSTFKSPLLVSRRLVFV